MTCLNEKCLCIGESTIFLVNAHSDYSCWQSRMTRTMYMETISWSYYTIPGTLCEPYDVQNRRQLDSLFKCSLGLQAKESSNSPVYVMRMHRSPAVLRTVAARKRPAMQMTSYKRDLIWMIAAMQLSHTYIWTIGVTSYSASYMYILKLVHRSGIQMARQHGIIDLRVDISGIILNMPGVQHNGFSAMVLLPFYQVIVVSKFLNVLDLF